MNKTITYDTDQWQVVPKVANENGAPDEYDVMVMDTKILLDLADQIEKGEA